MKHILYQKTMERKKEIRKILKIVIGLMIFSVGIYLGLIANIGLVPWDSLTMGISNLASISYGKINIAISVSILIIDLLLKEKIGIGTILDALLTGTFIDILYVIFPLKGPSNVLVGILYMTVGLFINSIGAYFCMSAGLSCGPRDTLLIAIGKRLPKLGIGYVDIIIKIALIILSLIVKGPIGIGTLYGMVGTGIAMQIVFNIIKFEPRDVVHENIFDSIANFK